MNPTEPEPAPVLVSEQLTQTVHDDLQVSLVYTRADLKIVAHAPGLRYYIQEAKED